jgi:hypothetical protein
MKGMFCFLITQRREEGEQNKQTTITNGQLVGCCQLTRVNETKRQEN